MKGTRPLSNAEIIEVAKHFTGEYEARNRGLFMLGVSIGGRISEMLSLTIGDVWELEKPVTDVVFDKSIVKGGEHARSVPLNDDARTAVSDLIAWHTEREALVYDGDILPYELNPDYPLFPSRKGGVLNRRGADAVLRKAFRRAGLNGKLGTHSLRKSFAQRLYDQTCDIFVVKEMLGHKSTDTTQQYLGVNYASLREALEAIATTSAARDTIPIYKANDVQLINELILRGYGVHHLPDKAKGLHP